MAETTTLIPFETKRSHYDDVRRRVLSSLATEGGKGTRTPSERQLAQQLGVSNATIGRVMQELQRAGIVERVQGIGTFIKSDGAEMSNLLRDLTPEVDPTPQRNGSVLARPAISSGRNLSYPGHYTCIIASFKPEDLLDPSQRWTLRATTAVERAVQGGGGRTLMVNTRVAPFGPGGLEEMAARGINSVVMVGAKHEQDCPQLGPALMRRYLAEERWPVVQIPFGTKVWPFDSVDFDSSRGIHSSVAHLWNLGHREIAFICPAMPVGRWPRERADAFQLAVKALSGGEKNGHVMLTPVPEVEPEFVWQQSTRGAAQQFFEDKQWAGVTAVLMINDLAAQVFMEEARALGKRIPEDVSVIGFDDHPWSSSLGLTTVHVPVEEMAVQAVEVMASPVVPPNQSRVGVVLNPPLMVRESTGPGPYQG